jgi:TonB family protein
MEVAMVRGGLFLAAGVLALASSARADDAEPPIAGEGARAVFLRAVHAHAHGAWSGTFLNNAAERLSASHPLNDRKRSVTVRIVLLSDGTLAETSVEQSSGSPDFDAAALAVFSDTMYPQPPEESLSDDGRAYLRWVFARDRRRCSGVSVIVKEGPLEEGLDHLLARWRDREALRRVRAAAVASPEEALSKLARAWLKRAFEQSAQALPASIGLAAIGDARGTDVLRAALRRGDRVPEVSAALRRLKVPVPPAPPPAPAAPEVASAALAKVLRKGEPAARLKAAVALSGRPDETARQALAALVRDPDPALRLFGAGGLPARERAALMAQVGADGKEAYRTLVRGPARSLAGQWLLAAFDKLLAPVQAELLSDWLWSSREASQVTLLVR